MADRTGRAGNQPADLPLPENAIQAGFDDWWNVDGDFEHGIAAWRRAFAAGWAQGAAAERAEAEADLADLRARLKATSDACNQARNELVAARTEGAAAERERIRQQINPETLAALADWFELPLNKRRPWQGFWSELQRWADLLAGDAP